MSTTKQLKVYKGLPTLIKSRARGYYDDKTILTFNTDAESQNITMDVYDGLSYDVISSASGVKVLNFVNTVLPYKWDYSTALSTNRYCFAPVLENMYYVDCYKYNNFTKVGSPTVDEDTGLVSGFSTSNYIQLRDAFNPANNPWEVRVKFTTSSNVTTVQEILHSRKGTGSSGRYGIGLSIDNTHFNFFCSSDGSDWLFDFYGTYTILTNTTYWVKIGWNGTEYYLEYSLDGETYTRDITNASTSGVYSPLTSSFIGVWNNGSFTNAFGGSIDLSETYINVNGSRFWEAKSEYSYNNFSVVGSLNIDYTTSVVSGFSSSNYLQLPEVFSPSSDPWEVQISIIKNEASLNRTRQIISCSGFQLGFTLESDSKYHLRLWTWDANGNGIFDSALNLSYNDMPNQIICRIYFTGSEYKVDYSTDKENWINIFQITSNTPVRNSGTIFIGTCYNSSYRTEYFTGSVDLSDTSISFNGVEWWRGVSPNRELMPGILSNYTDDGSAVTLNCFANGDTSVVLTPDNNYNGTYLGTVNIQAHTAYNYDPDTGEWTPNV